MFDSLIVLEAGHKGTKKRMQTARDQNSWHILLTPCISLILIVRFVSFCEVLCLDLLCLDCICQLWHLSHDPFGFCCLSWASLPISSDDCKPRCLCLWSINTQKDNTRQRASFRLKKAQRDTKGFISLGKWQCFLRFLQHAV
jgi:hypothetical protein